MHGSVILVSKDNTALAKLELIQYFLFEKSCKKHSSLVCYLTMMLIAFMACTGQIAATVQAIEKMSIAASGSSSSRHGCRHPLSCQCLELFVQYVIIILSCFGYVLLTLYDRGKTMACAGVLICPPGSDSSKGCPFAQRGK